jgi:hypothetical protein
MNCVVPIVGGNQVSGFFPNVNSVVDYHSAPPVKQSKFSSSFTFHEKAQVNEIKKNYIIAGLGGWSAGTA